MKNKNLILFILVGFIVTVALWGFVGGCGTTNVPMKKEPVEIPEENPSAEGLMLEKTRMSQEGSSYIVELGDTLWKISKKFGVSVPSIKEVNRLETDSISAGQRLIIPGVKIPEKEVQRQAAQEKQVQEVQKPELTPKSGTTVYTVRKNDSIWRIAQFCGTTIERITELNGLSKNAKLTPGQKILVPSNEPR